MLVFTVYLNRFAASIDLNEKDPVVHKHTPYIVILVTLAEKWASSHNGCLPATRQEKKEFKVPMQWFDFSFVFLLDSFILSGENHNVAKQDYSTFTRVSVFFLTLFLMPRQLLVTTR